MKTVSFSKILRSGQRRWMTTALICLALTLPLLAAGPDQTLAAGKVKLKVQSAFPTKFPIVGNSVPVLADTARTISDGEIELKIYEPRKLAPTLEIFDAIASGTLDAGAAYPGYWVGKNSAFNLFAAVPFGPTADEFLAWFYEGGGMELWRELYGKHNIVPLLAGLNSPEAGGWFTKEIKSLADLKGLKVRWAGLGANILKDLGVSTSLIPAGEVVTSLQKGILDGAEVGNPFIDKAFGMDKGAKFYYFPGWHQTFGTVELMINKAKWEKLTERQRAIIETSARASTIHSLAQGAALQADAMDYFKKEGIQIRRYPADVLQAIKDQTPKTLAAESAKNPDFKKVWESMKALMDKYEVYATYNSLEIK